MTNFNHLQSMSIDELTEWLDEHLSFDDAHHMIWFDQKYCKNCPEIMCKYEDSKYEFPASWCELEHKCKFFPEMDEAPNSREIVRMWLESEVE